MGHRKAGRAEPPGSGWRPVPPVLTAAGSLLISLRSLDPFPTPNHAFTSSGCIPSGHGERGRILVLSISWAASVQWLTYNRREKA